MPKEKGFKKISNVKVSIWPKDFFRFGISITSKNVFKPQKLNSDAFCHKTKL